ncbi:MAG: hypothetical protein EXR61_04460 [Chloroflexi bacterium]|nr:hypothetical protein [Chloroflexota bacterium]
MSADAVNAVLARAMDDATFRADLAADPQAALAGYDLTPDERARFVAGTAKAERLEERISKSDLSAGVSVKTSSPTTRPPSHRGKAR